MFLVLNEADGPTSARKCFLYYRKLTIRLKYVPFIGWNSRSDLIFLSLNALIIIHEYKVVEWCSFCVLRAAVLFCRCRVLLEFFQLWCYVRERWAMLRCLSYDRWICDVGFAAMQFVSYCSTSCIHILLLFCWSCCECCVCVHLVGHFVLLYPTKEMVNARSDMKDKLFISKHVKFKKLN
jgi:hypothetical protein